MVWFQHLIFIKINSLITCIKILVFKTSISIAILDPVNIKIISSKQCINHQIALENGKESIDEFIQKFIIS